MAGEGFIQIQPLEAGSFADQTGACPARFFRHGKNLRPRRRQHDLQVLDCHGVWGTAGSGVRTPQHQAGGEGPRLPDPTGERARFHAGAGPRFLHRIWCRADRAFGRRESGSGSRGRRRGRREASSQRALRQRNWRRRHEDNLLQRRRPQQEQASTDAERVFRRYGNIHRKDRPETGDLRRINFRRWVTRDTRCTRSAASVASSPRPMPTRC